MARNFAHLFLLALSALATSCADRRFKPVYPVSGSVTYLGKPTPGATVRFIAEQDPEHPWTRPSAMVDENGGFTVSTYNSNDGMPAGKYKVIVYWLPAPGASIETANKLPARYAKPETSNLSIEVKPEPNVLEPFVLTK